jgi:hypothetical protein
MPRYFDVQNTVLLVVGYGILPEAEDRPIAYEVKHAIDTRGKGKESCGAVVVTDMWVLNQEMAELFPAIAVGSPGVNAFAAQIYEELPVVLVREQQVFIQMEEERGKRAALWGLENRFTREAAELFVREGFLDHFLDLAWHRET